MSEQIKLSIVSRQAAPGGREYDSIVEDHKGTIALRDGVLFVRWETDGVKNLMKISNGKTIDIIRSGAITSRMTFEKGLTDRSSYQTAAGVMELETRTKELTLEGNYWDIDPRSALICIHISYELFVGGSSVSENEMLMKLESVTAQQTGPGTYIPRN